MMGGHKRHSATTTHHRGARTGPAATAIGGRYGRRGRRGNDDTGASGRGRGSGGGGTSGGSSGREHRRGFHGEKERFTGALTLGWGRSGTTRYVLSHNNTASSAPRLAT